MQYSSSSDRLEILTQKYLNISSVFSFFPKISNSFLIASKDYSSILLFKFKSLKKKGRKSKHTAVENWINLFTPTKDQFSFYLIFFKYKTEISKIFFKFFVLFNSKKHFNNTVIKKIRNLVFWLFFD